MKAFKRNVLHAAAALLMSAGAASAHAHLEKSNPVPGTTVTSPSAVTLQFSEGLELSFSAVTLIDARGNDIQVTDKKLSGAQDNVLSIAPASKLEPGAYHVNWHALSTDGHSTKGGFDFTVAP